jgi:integrase
MYFFLGSMERDNFTPPNIQNLAPRQQLEFWRSAVKDNSPDAFIFASATGTAIGTSNFLFRVLKEAGKKAGIPGVNHQMLRRTCSTYMAQLTTVKDVQAHLRHTNAKTTLEHYIKSVPESVRVTVESLDHLLKTPPRGDKQRN